MNEDARRQGSSQLSLFDAASDDPPSIRVAPAASPASDPDSSARQFAVDPTKNVVLEASAGTGKTSVLVSRYINLLKAGVDPANILAMTFTRKAAAEMRERIIRELKAAASRSEFDRARWNEVRDRLGEIAISTIDAFCLSLLREFPLEADLDPGFEMADETEVPRLIEDALDRSMRIFSSLAKNESDIALVLAQLGVSRTRQGLALLLDRRLVAWSVLDRFLASGPSDLTAAAVCRRAATALQDALRTAPGGLAAFLSQGPVDHPRYQLLVRDLRRSAEVDRSDDAGVRAVLDRAGAHFLTAEGKPRRSGGIPPYKGDRDYPSTEMARLHRTSVFQVAPQVERVLSSFTRDLNVILARGIRRMFSVALAQYREILEERSVLDFSDVLQRALALLRQMDEFSQSRFRLESRYHHVLVDEFQDTSRAQWELVSLLIQSWGEGLGLPTEPSIFIVGDRKQSIYRFRDAEVAVLQEAGKYIEGLRAGGNPRRSITRSFRALPELLSFVNDLFGEMVQPGSRPDDFTYDETDRFPIDTAADRRGPVLGLIAEDDAETCAAAAAEEIARILREESIRDRQTGVPRRARAGDIAILFRSRTSHREFQQALEQSGIPAYVYKGLGFFDADEIKDVSALIRYLADPTSDLRAAAFLRSRFVRVSDRAVARLGPRLASAITDQTIPDGFEELDQEDRRVLEHLRAHVADWLARVDRIPPADLVEQLLSTTAYAFELRGPRRQQAWENLKKMRGLIRRIQNRGYATLTRIGDHIDALTPGDESNAVIEALDAVNLMTIHASKGLEFPIVFVVNLARGASGPPDPIRVVADGEGGHPSVSVGPFVSDTDEAERDREKHETRRLLYVALTRARDRLYLSSVLKDRSLVPGRGSLAEVLPDSFKHLFNHAATAFEGYEVVGWTGGSGKSYDWRICRPPAATSNAVREESQQRAGVVDRFGAVSEESPTKCSVSEWLARSEEPHPNGEGRRRNVTAGILVHRLFQWCTDAGRADEPADLERARALLSASERASIDQVDDLVADAVSAWRRLRSRKDVVNLLAGNRLVHEVPFSMSIRRNGECVVLRGVIDCLVQKNDGSILVVEFKTGRPRPSHQRQLDLYVDAAMTIYPGARIDGRLVYAD